MAWVGVDPAIMGYGAVVASKKALKQAGLTVDQIDLVEVNEAFSVLPLMQIKDMGIDPEKVNVNGGAAASDTLWGRAVCGCWAPWRMR